MAAMDPIRQSTPMNEQGRAILGVCIACGVLESLAVGLRFLARRRMKASFRIDDWLIFASLWPNYAMIILGGFLVGEGKAGLPTAYLTPEQMVVFLQMLFASIITYVFTVSLVRISILLLYRRIFEIRPFRLIATGLIIACIIWGISVCAVDIFQCPNVPDAFKIKVLANPTSRCIDLTSILYGALGSGFALDLIILVLPFQQIWGLQLERRQKCELIAILSLGGLACIASVVRIITLSSLDSSNLSYSVATVYVWSQIEPSAAILCACFVTYRPLFRNLRLPSYLSRKSGVSNQSNQSDASRRVTAVGEKAWYPSHKVASSEEGLMERGAVGTTMIRHNNVMYPRDQVWTGP
ncbi:MAG: hypothetical protein Q9169_005208 [Polycauliona sp. 2 TL-2023]